jgi:hypothetical protein
MTNKNSDPGASRIARFDYDFSFENKSRQIGVLFLRSAIYDRASKKKRRDAGF